MATMKAGRRALLALALAVAAGCWAPPPPPVGPVRFYAAPGLPGALVAELARGFGIAEPKLVERVEEAEVAWLRDPTEALALGGLAPPRSAPEQPGLPDAFADPQRRFAPVGAVARVVVAQAGRAVAPSSTRDLTDPRYRGRLALARFDRGEGPLLVAALELAHGERGVRGWLDRLAANRPVWVDREEEVVARVASGEVPFGLTDTLTAGSVGAGKGLRVVFPDQKGKGCVAVPTALVVLPGAGAGARRFSAWLAGPVAEKILAERVVGLLPLRDRASAPDGMAPIWQLTVLALDWNALARGEAAWRERLIGWPQGSGGTR
jgi:iron(III) transport system substrate-binding protein